MRLLKFMSYNTGTPVYVNPTYVEAVGELYRSGAKPEDKPIATQIHLASGQDMQVIEALSYVCEELQKDD